MLVLLEVYVDIRPDQEEKEDWAKPLTAMWQSRPYDPQAERDYNKTVGQQMPFCSICLLFHTHYQVISLSSSEKSIGIHVVFAPAAFSVHCHVCHIILIPNLLLGNELLQVSKLVHVYLHLFRSNSYMLSKIYPIVSLLKHECAGSFLGDLPTLITWTNIFFHFQSESSGGGPYVTLVNRPGGQQWSKPLVPEMCFNTQSGEEELANTNMAEDGTSRLVSCAQCFVRVHTSKSKDHLTVHFHIQLSEYL